MKTFFKSFTIAAMLIISSFALIACNGSQPDPTNIVGTWVAESQEAPISKIQFIERNDGQKDIIYYLNGSSTPKDSSYTETTSGDTIVYVVIIPTGDNTAQAYRGILKDNKLNLSLESNPTGYNYTKLYDK